MEASLRILRKSEALWVVERLKKKSQPTISLSAHTHKTYGTY